MLGPAPARRGRHRRMGFNRRRGWRVKVVEGREGDKGGGGNLQGTRRPNMNGLSPADSTASAAENLS